MEPSSGFLFIARSLKWDRDGGLIAYACVCVCNWNETKGKLHKLPERSLVFSTIYNSLFILKNKFLVLEWPTVFRFNWLLKLENFNQLIYELPKYANFFYWIEQLFDFEITRVTFWAIWRLSVNFKAIALQANQVWPMIGSSGEPHKHFGEKVAVMSHLSGRGEIFDRPIGQNAQRNLIFGGCATGQNWFN